ncbi:hypothetical protein BZL29_6668 [Mycobacterium kansasii]|uniref:Uncharacterized protein n=1 Tax=Mycobacterium kansasii TaxID=1768 RepID=A0A1V3WMP2_MYCKA|nr:hypothetical protein BZL29_6668 [Mycobacterium kansasii]
MKAASEVGQRDRRGHADADQHQPDRRTRADQDAVDDGWSHDAVRPAPVCGVSAEHQQLVCGASLLFDDSTVPSLVVIEQLSLLTRKRLDASTEPTSDCEIGVTVIDHGM